MLPHVMAYNAASTGERLRDVARAMGVSGVDEMSIEDAREAAVDAVRQLGEDVGIPTVVDGLVEDDLDRLVADTLADACAPGNPREPTAEDVEILCRKVMA